MRVSWLVPVAAGAFLFLGCRSSDSDATSPEPRRINTVVTRAAERPGVAVREIGRSVEGRGIQAVTVGSGERTVVVIGGLHTGDEDETVGLVTSLLRRYSTRAEELPAGVRLVFLPNVNPDGYSSSERTNATGVDLNRNWLTEDWEPFAVHGDAEVFGGSQPLSEPETAALYDCVVGMRPDFVLSFHGYAGVVHHNSTQEASLLGAAFAEAADYELIDEWPYYAITGDLIEGLSEAGIAAADVELWEGDDQSFDRAVNGLEAVLEAIA